MPEEVARFQKHAGVHEGVQLGNVFILAALVHIYTVNGSYCCRQQDSNTCYKLFNMQN